MDWLANLKNQMGDLQAQVQKMQSPRVDGAPITPVANPQRAEVVVVQQAVKRGSVPAKPLSANDKDRLQPKSAERKPSLKAHAGEPIVVVTPTQQVLPRKKAKAAGNVNKKPTNKPKAPKPVPVPRGLTTLPL